MPFQVLFTPEAARQLHRLRAADRAAIADQCLSVLSVNPRLVSSSRVKRLQGMVFPPYRLREGQYRVFYDVEDASQRVVVYGVVSKADADQWLAASGEGERDEDSDSS